MVEVMCKVFEKYKSIFIDDQSCGVPTTIRLQSLQMDDRSIGVGKNLPKTVMLVFVNPDIFAMISEGIMRMKGLWTRFTFRLSSNCFFSILAMNFSRLSSSLHSLQGELLESEMLHSTSCARVLQRAASKSTVLQLLQIISFW